MNEEVRTELAIREESTAVMLTNRQLQMIANTPFVPTAFRGNVPAIIACVATGRALGLPDMVALRGIHVIEGKATLSAELMTAIVRSHGHSITGTSDAEKAIVKGKRADNGDTMQATFTIKMAERAGLLAKKGESWKRYPEAMLWARAVSQLCRMLFADCFAGATYVPEEAEETADELLDEPANSEQDEMAAEWVAGSSSGRGEAPARTEQGDALWQGERPRSLDEFRTWMKASGIDRNLVGARAKEVAPGKTADQFTAEEFEELYNLLQQEH